MKVRTLIISLWAVLLLGCSTEQPVAALRRPADQPVAEVKVIDKLTGDQLTAKRTFERDGYVLPYRLHAPMKPESGVVYPLIVFLHGSGERGSDNTRQLKHGVVPLCRYALKHGDAFVVAPQCPAGEKWVDCDWSQPAMKQPEQPSRSLQAVMDLLDELCATQPIDRTRIYVTGLSMGGYGAWDIVPRKPGFFAAAIPICGGVDEVTAPQFAGVGLRFFHGAADPAVPVGYSRRMSAALTAAGIPHGYTEIPKAGHDVWSRTYTNPEVLGWLFSKYRR